MPRIYRFYLLAIALAIEAIYRLALAQAIKAGELKI